MPNTNMSEFIDECLGKKKSKKVKKIKESKIDVKEILEQDEDDEIKLPDTEGDDNNEDNNSEDQENNEKSKDKEEIIKKAQKVAINHEIKGDKVLELAVKVDDISIGNIELGTEEYGTLTNLNALLDMYELSSGDITDPEIKIESLSITIQEEVSQTGKNNLSLMMRLNKDKSFSINVLVNEIGQTFNDLESAIQYFDAQYKTNILDTVNKKVRE